LPPGIYSQKAIIEGKYIDVINLSSQPISDIVIVKQKDALVRNRTQHFMSMPVLTGGHELFMSLIVVSRRKKNSYSGFSQIDEIFLKLLAGIMQSKIF
jgi:hypothetical protein